MIIHCYTSLAALTSLKRITSDACPQPGDSPGGRLFGLQITGAPEVLGEGPHPSPSYNSTKLTLAMGGSSPFLTPPPEDDGGEQGRGLREIGGGVGVVEVYHRWWATACVGVVKVHHRTNQ